MVEYSINNYVLIYIYYLIFAKLTVKMHQRKWVT